MSTVSLVVVMALVVAVSGSKWYLDVAEDPKRQNMCYDSMLKTYFELGSTWRRPDKCEGISCVPGDRRGMLTITGSTCPISIRLPTNCQMKSEKPSADYPHCCPAMSCRGSASGPVAIVV